MRKASAAALLVAASIILTVCLAPVGCGSNVGEKASGTTSSSAKSSASFARPRRRSTRLIALIENPQVCSPKFLTCEQGSV
ncbi:putative lipoprotein [Mycobacterium kansasii]|uniref:Putative lipoprotein n=1 Tax=Mycobacterium kansasii TaxID=1768 RepID=A0A1V3X3Y1_MYCKA|nr:putative lipoprotein [Mycobacterium kansasii]